MVVSNISFIAMDKVFVFLYEEYFSLILLSKHFIVLTADKHGLTWFDIWNDMVPVWKCLLLW